LYRLEVDRCPECGRAFDRRDPLSMGIRVTRPSRTLKRLQEPHSRFTFALPWALTGLILIAHLIPYLFGCLVVLAAFIWLLMFAEQIPSMLTRRLLAQSHWFSPDQLQSDKRLLTRMVKAICVSLLLFPFVPIYAFIIFFLLQSDLNRLAAYVPPSPVSYREFGSWRIGPFSPDAIDRLPHELDIGIMASHLFPTDHAYPPWAIGTVFILEDDPSYHYNNIARFHLHGQWYVEYRF
jgi:hypothetical protein